MFQMSYLFGNGLLNRPEIDFDPTGGRHGFSNAGTGHK